MKSTVQHAVYSLQESFVSCQHVVHEITMCRAILIWYSMVCIHAPILNLPVKG